MVSGGFKWFIFVLIMLNFGKINANNFVEVKPKVSENTQNLSVKLVLIDKTFQKEIVNLWEFYQFSKLNLQNVKEFAKDITKIYEKNGYLIPKIHYRKLNDIIYLIVPKSTKQNFVVSFKDDSKFVKTILPSTDSLNIFLDDYLKKLRKDGFLYSMFSLDSLNTDSSTIIANFSLDKGSKYQINNLSITPKKYDNKQIKSFFSDDTIFSHTSIQKGAEKLNALKFFEVEEPQFFYDSAQKALISTVNLKSDNYDVVDVMLGAENKEIVGKLNAKFSNLRGRINYLSVDFFKEVQKSEELKIEYGMLVSAKHLLSLYGKFQGVREDSTSGYISGEFGAWSMIKNKVKILVPINYSYYYHPKISYMLKTGVEVSQNSLKDSKHIVGGLYNFKWLIGANNSQVTKFSRDIEAEVMGGLLFYNFNLVGKVKYLNYSYPETYLIPATIIDANTFRGVLPFSEVIPELYAINLEANRFLFSNFGAYLFTDFIYYKDQYKKYNSKLGLGLGFQLVKDKNKVKIDVGTDVLNKNRKFILAVNFIFGI